MKRAALAAFALALAATPALAQDVTVVGLGGKTVTLTPAALAALPRATASLRSGDKATVYEGPTLTSILRESGTPQGPRMHGAPMKAYILVTGPDGYQVSFSIAEVDPEFREGPVILADRKAGAALDAREGPYRLIVNDDRKPWRAVRGVVRIEVKSAPPP